MRRVLLGSLALTVALGVAWGAAVLALLVQGRNGSRALLWASFAFPAYYVVLSLVLTARRRRPQAA